MSFPNVLILTMFLFATFVQAQVASPWVEATPEQLKFITENAYRIDDGAQKKGSHKNWKNYYKLTFDTPAFEKVVDQVEKVMCDFTKENRSVLIVGNPGESYKYIFARFSARSEKKFMENKNFICGERYDFELNMNKLQFPHVGETDAQFEKIIDAVSGKPIYLFIPNLRELVGKGAHSTNKNGLEMAFARAVSAGQISTVTFIDQYQYQELMNSEFAYVVDAFAQVIRFSEPGDEIIPLLKNYLSQNSNAKINDSQFKYIMSLGKRYQPSYHEPDRTLKVIDMISRDESAQSKINLDYLRKMSLATFGVPEWIVNKEYSRLTSLKSKLDSKVIGAENITGPLVDVIKTGYVMGRAEGRPVATSLFVGPTGLGKSFLPKKLAEYLSVELYVYDMTQYQNAYTADKFVDDISQKLITNPFSVFLLEEIDKSSREVLDKLYFMLDEGIFYGRGQRKISASSSIFLLTTNAAEFTVVDNSNASDLQSLVMKDLQKFFRPSFLNRFDNISIFSPFNDKEYRQLARVMVDEQLEYLKANLNMNVSLSQAVYDYIAINGQSKTFGARPMKRLIEKVVMSGLTQYQLEVKQIEEGSTILIDMEGDKFTIRINRETKKFTYSVDKDINNGGKRPL